jgi:catechol-2,3-dioxygenase
MSLAQKERLSARDHGNGKKTSLRVSHIWLYVKDIQTSIKFYRDTLGFKVVETFPDGALLNAGGILI